jgi:hypothetical protein
MEKKYFKNRKTKKSYTFNELINSEPIFKDDLIWTEGIPNWIPAKEFEELESYVLERPPERKSIVLLKNLKKSIFPALIIVIIFSIILGISSGLIEKWKYEVFLGNVQPRIDKYYQEKREREEEVKSKKFNHELDIKNKLTMLELDFNLEDSKLKFLQEEAYRNYQTSRNYESQNLYITRANSYLNQRQELTRNYQTKVNKLNSELNERDNQSNVIEYITYDVPTGTLATFKDNGDMYTRWSVYQGVGNHEQISYNKTYKFLFRPYKSFFIPVNLSNEEISDTKTLLWNFTLSAFMTNLMFLPIILLGVMRYKRKKNPK